MALFFEANTSDKLRAICGSLVAMTSLTARGQL
jgi:hypothetical protein